VDPAPHSQPQGLVGVSTGSFKFECFTLARRPRSKLCKPLHEGAVAPPLPLPTHPPATPPKASSYEPHQYTCGPQPCNLLGTSVMRIIQSEVLVVGNENGREGERRWRMNPWIRRSKSRSRCRCSLAIIIMCRMGRLLRRF